MNQHQIHIQGARQHNLQNIELTLPRNALVIITGLSGSGKSTLAFDTLYAEGQRRYVESLSAYARQFLERLDKPDVDLIEGLSPAIAIEQKSTSHNPRSTVGTVTEIYDYLRLLYARVGQPHCHRCQIPINTTSVDQILAQLMAYAEGTRLYVMAPLVQETKGDHANLLKRLRTQGFSRVLVDGRLMELEEIQKLSSKAAHTIDVVVDRLVIKPSVRSRLADSVEMAIRQGQGRLRVQIVDPTVGSQPQAAPQLFSETAACPQCGLHYPEFTPASFSFNAPQGACPHCNGLGASTEFDPEAILPNRNLSLRDGAVLPWAHRNSVHFVEFLEALTAHYDSDIYTPVKDLPEPFVQTLLHGSGEENITFFFEQEDRRHTYQKPFEGIIPNLERRYLETDSAAAREEIKRYMTFRNCSKCGGTRLNPASRAVKIGAHNISAICALSIEQAASFFKDLTLTGRKQPIAQKISTEIRQRLGFLIDVGLPYLTLGRAANTLSGGESQRIRLATQIGSKLTGVLYVLDEPSIGLHQRDNQRLLDTLLKMRDMGNTVLVVEHDTDTILAADHVVDMGPGAGINGGRVVFSGTPADLLKSPDSLTGQYLSGRRCIEIPARRRKGNGQALTIYGARANNLKQIEVTVPLGCLIGVTGVSGSGKSTLVIETLYKLLAQHLYQAKIPAGDYERVTGLEHIDKVINIDQGPIGKTPRSNPGTYTAIFTHIRELFARTPQARARGFKSGRFSFNVKGGRCESCSGDGILKIEMHFLPDVYVTCDTCHGSRYNHETLEIRYKGKTVADVLDMTVNQAMRFFENIPSLQPKLQTLADVGLGYIRIGQPATTLSGGEAQRIKLARELSKRGTGRTLYILDEPTTGLHSEDIQRLLHVLNQLVLNGNTVLVIEHNLDVIKCADYVIDLGPEGGDQGGQVIACGTPEELAQVASSHTGNYLQRVLNGP